MLRSCRESSFSYYYDDMSALMSSAALPPRKCCATILAFDYTDFFAYDIAASHEWVDAEVRRWRINSFIFEKVSHHAMSSV